MVPIGAIAHLGQVVAPPLITLYNLFPSATIVGGSARGFSSGESMAAMEQIAKEVLPSDVSYEWSAMSYQEKITGNQLYYVFGLSVLLVYLVPGWPVRELDPAAGRAVGGAAGAGRTGYGADQPRGGE